MQDLHNLVTVRNWPQMRARAVAECATAGLVDIACAYHDTLLGRVLLATTDTGLLSVSLPGSDEREVLEHLTRRVSARLLFAHRPTLAAACLQLDEYFAGQRQCFDLPLDWRLTGGFRRAVLDATATIPYGATASYREMATAAGNGAAVRAAGSALARNPLPLIIPCHRVLRSDGGLGGYGGGVGAKVQLLTLEHENLLHTKAGAGGVRRYSQ